MIRKIITTIVSLLLVTLFTYAAVSKLIDYEKFRFQLGRSPFISEYTSLISWAIPSVELIIASLLIVDKSRIIGLYLSFALMLLFTGYIYAMLHFSYFIPCSCGGVLASMSWNQHLVFNAVFTLLPLLAIVADRYKAPDRIENLLKHIP